MLGLLDRSTQLTDSNGEAPVLEPLTREAALKTTSLAATLLFAHGQTTERMVVTTERLGRALGVSVRVLPDWDKLTIEIEGTSLSQIVPAKPLGVDMNRVLAIARVVDRLCGGTLRAEDARPALLLAGNLPPASALRFTSFAAIGATSLGVIFGAFDATNLMLIAGSGTLGALVRRWLSGFNSSPFIQPLCAAVIAGAVAATATSLHEPIATARVAFCPCMVLVPGPIFALHAKLENRVRDLRDNRAGHLSIVATPPLAYSLIPPALSDFLRRRPQTRMFFDVRRYEGIIDGVLSRVAELGFALGFSHHPGIAHEVVHEGEMVCVLPSNHALADRDEIAASDLVGLPFIGLERGTRLGEAVRDSFAKAGAPFQPTVEVRYCNTACVLAAAGVGAAVVDPFSPRQGGNNGLLVRPFVPRTPALAYMLWSEAEPLSRLAKAFLDEVRQASRVLDESARM